ncbi:MAG: NUDIX domain-containing protein [bacterium]|nr:NUDIX domain-containing protein [bacterium]
MKLCDHKSVGMLVWKKDKLLLIERKRPPFGFAPPAGHVDKDVSFEESAERELKEEVGLDAKTSRLLIEGRKENPCRRDGGTWHYWKIYQVGAIGEIIRSEDETKQANFYTKNDLFALATKTESYLRGDIKQNDWEKSPGLEPVWHEWLKELKII